MMQLIINISESMLNELRTCKFPIQDAYRLCAAIENGTPLPKGHGDLIDTKKIIVKPKYMQNCMGEVVIRAEDLARIIADTPTIIEADKDR